MTSHKLFTLGKASLAAGILTAPVPLVTCIADGRAGWTALLPLLTGGASIALFATHDADLMDCEKCMNHVAKTLGAATETDASFVANHRQARMAGNEEYTAFEDEYADAFDDAPVQVPAPRDFADRYAAHHNEMKEAA